MSTSTTAATWCARRGTRRGCSAGEGLHLVNLVAGNFLGSRVYDRELLEGSAGADLLVHIGPGGPGGRRVPQRPARPRPRARPAGAARDVPHGPRGLGPAVRLAAEQGGVRRAAGTRRHHRVRASVPVDVPRRRAGRLLRHRPVGGGPRAGRRRGPRRRRLGGRALAVRGRGRRLPVPPAAVLRPAAGGDGRLRRVPVVPARPRRRVQPAGVVPGLRAARTMRRCRWRPSRTRCAPAGRWSRTVRGSRSRRRRGARAPCSTGPPAAGCGSGPRFRVWTR